MKRPPQFINDLDWFADEFARFKKPEGRIAMVNFRGDPEEVDRSAWRARPYRLDLVDMDANLYFSVATMKPIADDYWGDGRERFGRTKAHVSAINCLMIDDIGPTVGGSTKAHWDILSPLPMSGLVASSLPGTPKMNCQGFYFFDDLFDDIEKFDALTRGFIDKFYNGNDPGMGDPTRLFRAPGGRNQKAKYCDTDRRGSMVTLLGLDGERRYNLNEISRRLAVPMIPLHKFIPVSSPAVSRAPEYAEKVLRFNFLAAYICRQGMFTAPKNRGCSAPANLDNVDAFASFANAGGWIHCHCPFHDGDAKLDILAHGSTGTGKRQSNRSLESGAALRLPSIENEYSGAFRCWHGHGRKLILKDVMDWYEREITQQLEHKPVTEWDGDFVEEQDAGEASSSRETSDV